MGQEAAVSTSLSIHAIVEKLQAYKRQALVPITNDEPITDDIRALTTSKFSGHPLITSEATWATCPNCEEKMQLLWQQDLAQEGLSHSYPIKAGLLQVFMCLSKESTCDVECQTFFPFSSAVVARVVPVTFGTMSDGTPDALPTRTIVGWDVVDDYPDWDTLDEAGVRLLGEEMDIYGEMYPLAGEKVGGWPHWIQGPEYPNCSQCSSTMEYLLQIDSHHNLDHTFGDCGVGYLTYCKSHPEILSFHVAG